jgi:hypothetical protein
MKIELEIEIERKKTERFGIEKTLKMKERKK